MAKPFDPDEITIRVHAGPMIGCQNEPAVLVESNALCSDCGKVHDIEVCPRCGAFIEIGDGFLFGGYGLYKHCYNRPTCSWWWKEQDMEGMEDE